MSISTCALREEGDPAIIKITASHSGFLSTPSARRATDRQKHSSRTFTISIHALREEGDGMCWGFPRRRPKFLSTPSARRATIFIRSGMALLLFLSTPSARRATGASVAFDQYEGISIHALREEGDPFSRRTPGNNTRFLSTPSARRATDEQFVLLLSHGISIHALREEGDPGLVRHHPYDHISIHALREEGDIAIIVEVIFEPDFYPRPPRGGRRRARPTRLEVIYFYPRPPRGGRPGSLCHPLHTKQFLSTPSARRATDRW